MARRAARVAAKESLEKEKEERIKGLGSRDAEHILNEYPDTDTDSDCYEVVDGQRAKGRPRSCAGWWWLPRRCSAVTDRW